MSTISAEGRVPGRLLRGDAGPRMVTIILARPQSVIWILTSQLMLERRHTERAVVGAGDLALHHGRRRHIRQSLSRRRLIGGMSTIREGIAAPLIGNDRGPGIDSILFTPKAATGVGDAETEVVVVIVGNALLPLWHRAHLRPGDTAGGGRLLHQCREAEARRRHRDPLDVTTETIARVPAPGLRAVRQTPRRQGERAGSPECDPRLPTKNMMHVIRELMLERKDTTAEIDVEVSFGMVRRRRGAAAAAGTKAGAAAGLAAAAAAAHRAGLPLNGAGPLRRVSQRRSAGAILLCLHLLIATRGVRKLIRRQAKRICRCPSANARHLLTSVCRRRAKRKPQKRWVSIELLEIVFIWRV